MRCKFSSCTLNLHVVDTVSWLFSFPVYILYSTFSNVCICYGLYLLWQMHYLLCPVHLGQCRPSALERIMTYVWRYHQLWLVTNCATQRQPYIKSSESVFPLWIHILRFSEPIFQVIGLQRKIKYKWSLAFVA